MENIGKNIDIVRLIELLYRKKYLFFIVFVLVTIMSIIYSYTAKKKYRASAVILVERDKIINPLMRGLAVDTNPSERLMTIRQLITSRSRLLQVIKELDLDLEVKSELGLENLIESMKRAITIRNTGNNLYTISFEGSEPEKVKNITNTICNLFIEENLGVGRGEAHDAFEFIKAQLALYEKKLEDSENALRLFKEENIGQLPGEENVNLGRLMKYQTSLSQAEIELKEALLKRELLEKQLSAENPLISFSSSDKSLEIRLVNLESELNFLLTKYTEKYPEVIKLKTQIEEIKELISKKEERNNKDSAFKEIKTEILNPLHQKIKEDLNEINIAISSLQTRIKDYKIKVELYEDKVKSIPTQEQELAQLSRGYSVNESIYRTLLNKLEEARISKELDLQGNTSKFQIIDAAQLPLLPKKPNRPMLILIGMILGLCAGTGIIFLFYYTDSSIATPNEAKTYFNYPILASIPRIETSQDIYIQKKKNIKFIALVSVFISFSFCVILFEMLKRLALIK